MYVNGNRKQSEMTAVPDKYPQGYFKEKECKECSKLFRPQAPSHLYCSQKCNDRAYSRAYLRRTYKIELEDFEQMMANQNELCAICHEVGFKMALTAKNLLVVDHCHTTGKVRGLLCHNCNRGLGLFKDKIDRLNRAVGYLEGATTIPKGST